MEAHKKIKIVAFADTHGDALKIDKLSVGDIVICAGDFSTCGKVQDTAAFAYEFGQVKAKHRICVAGNHDWLCEGQTDMARQIFRDNNIIYLHDEEIVLDGIKFYGTPYQLRFFDWAFNKSEEELKVIYARIPNDVDILITHNPPFGILGKNARGGECGSAALKERLDNMLKRPRLHIFGHLHESSGILEKDGTIFCNASLLDDNYIDKFDPYVIEI